jgi:hypothetical protein
MATILESPLSSAQIEILKVFARPMDDEELLALKRHLVRFFADRIALASEEIWHKKQWKTEDTEQLRQRHLRTPYRKA